MKFEDFEEQLKVLQPPKKVDEEYMKRYNQMLQFVFDKVENDVRLYTHIPIEEELPVMINQIMILMASSFIVSCGLINDEETNENDSVKRITEGDTSIEYTDRTTLLQKALAASSISGNFKSMLNRVRRLQE